MDEQDSGMVGQVQTASEAQAAPDQNSQIAGQLAELHRSIGNGAGWFYWLAALSIINSILALAGSSWGMIFGLGATQVVDILVRDIGSKAAIIGIPVNLFIAGVYVLFGYCAHQRMRWAFYVGMVLYVLDALLLIFLLDPPDWLGVAFHGWALFSIYRGLQADGLARQLEARTQSPVI